MAETPQTTSGYTSLGILCRTHHIPPYALRQACDEGHFPYETRKELVHNEKTRLYTRYSILEGPQFQTWFEGYKAACLAEQAQRAKHPVLALGMFAAWNGIALVAFPQAQQAFRNVEEPLKEALYCIEQQGQLHQDLARAAAKEVVRKAIRKGRGNGWMPSQTVIDHYVDQLFDQVLGTPLWQQYLSFCHREKTMIAAYRQAFFASQGEWHPQPGGDESIFLEEDEEAHGDKIP